VSYEGLGKQWINGPGFIKWLEEMRPVEMRKNHKEAGVVQGGRSVWASDSDCRAMYRAEFESGTISLDVADRLCVKLDLHIDSEMPDDLWVDKGPQGRPKAPGKKQAKWHEGLKWVPELKTWVRA
jgi:hypothetical protein